MQATLAVSRPPNLRHAAGQLAANPHGRVRTLFRWGLFRTLVPTATFQSVERPFEALSRPRTQDAVLAGGPRAASRSPGAESAARCHIQPGQDRLGGVTVFETAHRAGRIPNRCHVRQGLDAGACILPVQLYSLALRGRSILDSGRILSGLRSCLAGGR